MVVASEWVGGDKDHSEFVTQPTWPINTESNTITDKVTASDMSSSLSLNGDHESFNQPKAIFLCRPNSHPFQERNLILSQAIKIGRSVARDRVLATNAIFECKVLSRNHALLWYENGKFYLQDTKSSNGTFVNGVRLSGGGVESAPHELRSGDTVQFGVDVIENTRKVTHGCIVAALRLFLPDGSEAAPRQQQQQQQKQQCGGGGGAADSGGTLPHYHGVGVHHTASLLDATVNSVELYQLNQYIQEATARERHLETKLAHLQRVVESTKSSAQQAWRCLLQEDSLLTRIDVLETQLRVYSTDNGEDKLRADMVSLLSDKLKYQEAAKEQLRRAVEEKLAAGQRNRELENALQAAEREAERAGGALAGAQRELQDISGELQSTRVELSRLGGVRDTRLAEAERDLAAARRRLADSRHAECVSRARWLCSQARLARAATATQQQQGLAKTNCNATKNFKSESDILDNASYRVTNESLLSKMDQQIEHLQRRLAEINSAAAATATATATAADNDKRIISTTGDVTEESVSSDDSGSDITVIGGGGGQFTPAVVAQLKRMMMGQEEPPPTTAGADQDAANDNGGGGGAESVTGTTTTTTDSLNNVAEATDDDVTTQCGGGSMAEQVTAALLELRAQRDLLQRAELEEDGGDSETDNKEKTTQLVEKSQQTNALEQQEENNHHNTNTSRMEQSAEHEDTVLLRAENERLAAVVEDNERQISLYEQRLDELQRKLESLGLELETRPGNDQLQEKENRCFDQEIALKALHEERESLQEQLTNSRSVERELQIRIDEITRTVDDLMGNIAVLQSSIEVKEECIGKLTDEMCRKPLANVTVNEDSSAQTESVPNVRLSETTTQTPVRECVDFENAVQKDFDFPCDPANNGDDETEQLQEELVQLKERYVVSSQENCRLLADVGKLQADYDSALRQSRTMVFVYLAPILALMCYLLLTQYFN